MKNGEKVKRSNRGLDSINHVAITVNSIEESVKWYKRNFNCTIVYQDETWAKLEFANINLALVVSRQHPGHLGFVVQDADKYGELKTHRDGTRSVYIQDPTGNAVEIMSGDSID